MKSFALSQNPEQQQALKKAIKQKVAAKTFAEWREIFADVDACVEPVLTIEEAAEHPQMKARGMVVERDRGDSVGQQQVGLPIRFG